MQSGSLKDPEALCSGEMMEILIENPDGLRKNLISCSAAISCKAVTLIPMPRPFVPCSD